MSQNNRWPRLVGRHISSHDQTRARKRTRQCQENHANRSWLLSSGEWLSILFIKFTSTIINIGNRAVIVLNSGIIYSELRWRHINLLPGISSQPPNRQQTTLWSFSKGTKLRWTSAVVCRIPCAWNSLSLSLSLSLLTSRNNRTPKHFTNR